MTDSYQWPSWKPGEGPQPPPRVAYTPLDPEQTGMGSRWLATFHPTGATCEVTLSRERQYPGLRWGDEHVHAAQYAWAAADIMRRAEASTVRDFGCGSGMGTAVLAQSVPDAVFGYDVSEEAIRFASMASPGVYYMASEMVGLFADATVAIEVLEHVADDVMTCHDWRDNTDGGHLYLTTPDASARPKGYQLTEWHLREYTPEQLQALLAETGWRVVEWKRWKNDPVCMGVIAEAV